MIDFTEQELELLPQQGYCNENYLLTQQGNKYLVRKFKLADRDRKLEYKIQKAAYHVGIAAKPLYLDKAIMISEFAEGVHQKKLSKKETRNLAKALKKLHRIPFRSKKVHFKSPFKPDFALCHNDLSVQNILFGDAITLIDWEYAGVADRYFDLATVCEAFVLDERCFFRAYGRKINKRKLRTYKKIYRQVTAAWFKKLARGELAGVLEASLIQKPK